MKKVAVFFVVVQARNEGEDGCAFRPFEFRVLSDSLVNAGKCIGPLVASHCKVWCDWNQIEFQLLEVRFLFEVADLRAEVAK